MLTCITPRGYRANAVQDNLKLAKTCLTYLLFDDFDTDDFEDLQDMRCHMKEHRLLRYCVQRWQNHVRFKEEDESLLEYLHRFLSPRRSNQYLSWISWVALIKAEISAGVGDGGYNALTIDFEQAAILFTKLADSSPLHYAVAMGLPSLCRWLISKGCDVNQSSAYFGVPLLAALRDEDPLPDVGGQQHSALPLVLENDKKCLMQTLKVLIVSSLVPHL